VVLVGATDSEVLGSEGAVGASDAGPPRDAGARRNVKSQTSSGSEGIEWLRESSATGRRGASEDWHGSESESEDTSLGSLAVHLHRTGGREGVYSRDTGRGNSRGGGGVAVHRAPR
jgi:hypothetical protein